MRQFPVKLSTGVNQFMASASRSSLIGFIVLAFALAFYFPLALIKTFLAITPFSNLLYWGALFIGNIALLWWLDRVFHRPKVKIVSRDSIGIKKWLNPHHVANNLVLVLIIGVLLFSIASGGLIDGLTMAKSKARQEFRNAYDDYVVISLRLTDKSGSRSGSAKLLAYTESDIDIIDVSWVD